MIYIGTYSTSLIIYIVLDNDLGPDKQQTVTKPVMTDVYLRYQATKELTHLPLVPYIYVKELG